MKTYIGMNLAAFEDAEEREQHKVVDDTLRDIVAALSRAVFPGTQPAANPVPATPPPGSPTLPNPTQGDLLYGLITGSWAKLPIGTNGFLLSVAGGTPAWNSPSALLPVHTHVDTSQGGQLGESALLLADNTTNDVTSTKHGFTPKSPGDTTKFLRGDATPSWQTVAVTHDLLSASHTDTLADTVIRGDLIVANSTPKWARLPISGSSGKVLHSNGTDATWQALVASDLPSHDNTKHDNRTRRITFPIGCWQTLGVILQGTEPNAAAYEGMLTAVVTRTHMTMTVPNDYVSGASLLLHMASAGGDAAGFDMNVYTLKLVNGTTLIDAAYNNLDSVVVSTPGTKKYTNGTATISTSLAAGDVIRLTVERDGGSDGNIDNAFFLGADFVYTADM